MSCRSLWAGGLIAGLGALYGCTPPLVRSSESDPPPLQKIRAKYEDVVTAAREDPNTRWHSSWVGNIFVNTLGGSNRGLCYEWQDYVYRGVAPTVFEVGWHTTGLVSNEGNDFEHHCVLVWDPKLISEGELLTRTPPRPVYVLDAWHQGTANIHWLDQWLDNERPHRSPIRLQVLPVEMEPVPSGGTFEAPRPDAR
jgi:hypothetical protein